MLPHAADAGGSGTSGVAFVLAVAGALILALVLAEIVAAALRAVGRRRWLPAFLARRTRMPVRTLLAVVGVWVGVDLVGDRLPGWFEQAAALATIAAAAWLLAVVLPACTDAALSRHRMDAPGRRHARGSRALAGVIRRVVVGLVLLAAVTAALLVLDGTRVAGLVSAGALVLALVVLGAVVVPWLRDVAAGAQLALTDAVRLDDVIAVDGEWGRVEEITATSVLLQAWDDRRVVVPSRRLTGAALRTGPAAPPIWWAPSTWTSTRASRSSRSARSWSGWWRATTCGTGASRCCRWPTPPAAGCGSAPWSAPWTHRD